MAFSLPNTIENSTSQADFVTSLENFSKIWDAHRSKLSFLERTSVTSDVDCAFFGKQDSLSLWCRRAELVRKCADDCTAPHDMRVKRKKFARKNAKVYYHLVQEANAMKYGRLGSSGTFNDATFGYIVEGNPATLITGPEYLSTQVETDTQTFIMDPEDRRRQLLTMMRHSIDVELAGLDNGHFRAYLPCPTSTALSFAELPTPSPEIPGQFKEETITTPSQYAPEVELADDLYEYLNLSDDKDLLGSTATRFLCALGECYTCDEIIRPRKSKTIEYSVKDIWYLEGLHRVYGSRYAPTF